MNHNVLIVGADLTSNGGIASVVKSYYEAYKKGNYEYDMHLLKTSYYKDKGIFANVVLLFVAFFKFLKKQLVDEIGIVHIHSSAHRSFYRKSIFVMLSKLTKKKVILHLHSSDFYTFFLKKNRFKKFIFSKSDCVVVLCKDWEKQFKRTYPSVTVEKIENPFSKPNNSHLKHDKDEDNTTFKILFVGFLIESKGIVDLIELAKKIKKAKIDDCIIQIAGKGPLEGYLLDIIEKEGLKNVVEPLGWISGERKDQVFTNADVFILPSYKEGMPISILEAMSYGLPIISTDISGIPDLIVHNQNGYLLEPGDVQGYFNSIIDLRKSPEKLNEMKVNNLKRVEQNTKENIFKEIDILYKKNN